MLCALHHHAFEAHVGHCGTNLVVVDERAVAEDLRILSEELLDFLRLTLCLGDEVFCVAQGRQTMTVGLCQELYTAGGSQTTEEVKHLRSVLFDELQ